MRVNYQQLVKARSAADAAQSEVEVARCVKADKATIQKLEARVPPLRREAIRLASIWNSQQNSAHAAA